MIEYRLPEEKQYLELFVNEMKEQRVLDLVHSNNSISAEDARYLCDFFWNMVDRSIELGDNFVPFPEGAEFWNEKLMHSISAFVEDAGFEKIWDEVVDQQ